jgi:hypothetical protein
MTIAALGMGFGCPHFVGVTAKTVHFGMVTGEWVAGFSVVIELHAIARRPIAGAMAFLTRLKFFLLGLVRALTQMARCAVRIGFQVSRAVGAFAFGGVAIFALGLAVLAGKRPARINVVKIQARQTRHIVIATLVLRVTAGALAQLTRMIALARLQPLLDFRMAVQTFFIGHALGGAVTLCTVF